MQKNSTLKINIVLLFFLNIIIVTLPLKAQQNPTDDSLVTPVSTSIIIKPQPLPSLSYFENTGPSATESFTVSANNLTAGKPIIIDAPKNFEVSLDGIDWDSEVTLPNTAGGELPPTTVYIRLVSGLDIGDYRGDISVSGGGNLAPATSALSGTVTKSSKSVCVSGDLLMGIRSEDFGTFPSMEGRECADPDKFHIDSAFICYTEGPIRDSGHSVLANSFTDSWTVEGPDHTPDDPPGTHGAMLFVNHGETAGNVIFSRAWPVCSGMDLKMSAWYADANNHIAYSIHIHVPGITFYIYGGDSPDNCNTLIVKQSESPPFVKSHEIIWHQILVPFNTGPHTYIRLKITNDVHEVEGNDLLVDDIKFPTAPLPVEVCVTDVTCKGACNGEVTVKRVSGNSTFTFVLDGSVTKTGTSATFTDVCAGSHTLKIEDKSGTCDVIPEVVVNEPPELAAKAVSIPACGESGTIGMLVTGGTPGYQYRVGSGEWGSNPVITGLSNGSYTIDVRDVSGCIVSAKAEVAMILPATIKLTSDPGTDDQTLYINSSITDINYKVDGGGTTGVEVEGLPKGLSSSYSSGVVTISGIPAQSGTFNYTVSTKGTEPACAASISGTITIGVKLIAEVLDENGNGFIDRINFTIEGKNSTILKDKMPSAGEYIKTMNITNHLGEKISFRPQEIERVNDKTFALLIDENSGTSFETGWKTVDFSTHDISVVASGAFSEISKIIDKAGPVITRVLYEYGDEGKKNDKLFITLSEPVKLKNSENSPPIELFNYYQEDKLAKEAFESIEVQDFSFETDMMHATVILTNGFFVLPIYDSLQLKNVYERLVDNNDNSAHESSRITVIEGELRFLITVTPVENPYILGTEVPENSMNYYSKVFKDDNKKVALVEVKSRHPLGELANGSFGNVAIYDCVGNLIQRGIPIYQANSPTLYGFTWDAKNLNQKYVYHGVYLAIVKAYDLYKREHVFIVKLGIKASEK